MAAPHVAGAAALYLLQNPGASPATVKRALLVSGDITPCANSADGTCADDPDGIQEPLLLLACGDADGDGVCDDVDNCSEAAKPDHRDTAVVVQVPVTQVTVTSPSVSQLSNTFVYCLK